MHGTIRIGVSGWRYPPWRGHFYPRGWPQTFELDYASSQLPSIELNGSFYSLQRPSSYRQWAQATPPGFVFSIKGSHYITHLLRLKDVHQALANFFASGLLELGEKLGPILWQFPPNMAFDRALFEAFFAQLPHTAEQAAHLAEKRDGRMSGRESLQPHSGVRLRHAIEVRHLSFADPVFIALLRHYGLAWVVADTPKPWPNFHDITTDFVYVRLHGGQVLYRSAYSSDQLDQWAARIRAWAAGQQAPDARLISSDAPAASGPRDIFCYFDNTDKLHAPDNAQALLTRLGVGLKEAPTLAACYWPSR